MSYGRSPLFELAALARRLRQIEDDWREKLAAMGLRERSSESHPKATSAVHPGRNGS